MALRVRLGVAHAMVTSAGAGDGRSVAGDEQGRRLSSVVDRNEDTGAHATNGGAEPLLRSTTISVARSNGLEEHLD